MDPSSSSNYELYSGSTVNFSTSTDELSQIDSNTEWHGFKNVVDSRELVAPSLHKINGSDRSHSFHAFSHSPLTKIYHEKRSASAVALLEKHPHTRKVKDTVRRAFGHIKARLSSSEPDVDEEENAFSVGVLDIEQLEQPKRAVEGLTRDSLSLGEVSLENFSVGNVPFFFRPAEVQKLAVDFVDEDKVKKEACQKSLDIARVVGNLRKEINDCKQQLVHASSEREVLEIKKRCTEAKGELKKVFEVDGETFADSQDKAIDVEELRMINCEFGAETLKEPGVNFIDYQSEFMVHGSQDRYVFRKTGQIFKNEVGLYVLEAQHSLRRLSS